MTMTTKVITHAVARRCRRPRLFSTATAPVLRASSSSPPPSSSSSPSPKPSYKPIDLKLARRKHADIPLIAEEPILMRDFIRYALYDPTDGYFNKHDRITRYEPIDFGALRDAHEFQLLLHERYKGSSFLTPVEVFQPWYGQAVGEWIMRTYLQRYDDGRPLHIYEIGGAKGTCALNILDMFRDKYPEVYARTQYVNVEQSVHHVSQQHEELSTMHAEHYRVVCESFVETTERDDQRCFVFGLEVLDNMPHDQVVVAPGGTHMDQAQVFREPMHNLLSELYGELSDPLIIETLNQMIPLTFRQRNRIFPGRAMTPLSLVYTLRALASFIDRKVGDYRVFVPTTCVQMLKKLHANFPQHELLLMDFDCMSGDTLSGTNGPLVQYPNGKSPNNILRTPGSLDIIFPTNFYHLEHMHRHFCNGRDKADLLTNRKFVATFGQPEKCAIPRWPFGLRRTNPFLTMYQENTTIFIGGSDGGGGGGGGGEGDKS